MRDMMKAAMVTAALYLLQFALLPLLAAQYFPRSNEAYILFGVTAAAASVLTVFVLKCKLRQLLAADGVYFLLILMYPAKGAYGIGIRGISLDGLQGVFSGKDVPLGALIAVCILLLVQLLLILCRRLAKAVLPLQRK